MKLGKQIAGLPLYGLTEGREIGTVKGFVCNPDGGAIDALLIDGEAYYLELRAVLTGSIIGIGEFAVTVQDAAAARPVTSQPAVYSLLQRDVKVLGSRVLTRVGEIIGTVSELAIDEKTGTIAGCELTPLNEEKAAGFIRRSDIITYGDQYLVVDEGCTSRLASLLEEITSDITVTSKAARADQGDTGSTVPVSGEEVPEQNPDMANLFNERQRQFLVGRKLEKQLVAKTGELIGEEGDLITEELIEKSIALDKYFELTMNTSK